jgi:two-component system, chemotaxis family, response regulator Rcp1
MNCNMDVIEILMVEDSPSDIFITQHAIQEAKVLNHLHIVEDGIEAMAFLRKEGKYADAPRPDIVLLDLNLPRKDGREVLAEVKADPRLKIIPIVVLTSSKSDEDILRSYGLHANCYITKPVDFSRFKEVVKAIESFWFTIVTLPQCK